MNTSTPDKTGMEGRGSAQDALQHERQLVIFDLSKESYGVDIGTVREIIRIQEITKVPRTPEFVEGLINLRGKVIPVIDLRKRFMLEATHDEKNNRIVVVDIGGQDIGVIVDAVTEVLRIPSDCVEPPSSIISDIESEYLLGIAKLSARLIILLDLNRVLSGAEKEHLSEVGQLTPEDLGESYGEAGDVPE